MEFVHDNGEKEWGKRASLLNGFVDGDFGCDAAADVGTHGEGGALKGVAYEVNKGTWGANAAEGTKDTRPANGVVCFGDVIEYGVAGMVGGAWGGGVGMFEALEYRGDGVVYVFPRKEGIL